MWFTLLHLERDKQVIDPNDMVRKLGLARLLGGKGDRRRRAERAVHDEL
jgi:hypothetical protein